VQILNDWLSRHKGILFKITRAYAFKAQDQDGLFQEISLQLWKSIPNIRGDAKASTWIYRAALYTAGVWVRVEKKRPPAEALAGVEHTLRARTEPRDERVRWLYEQIAALKPVDRSLAGASRVDADRD
jgi:RNA polymerase sigma-70 factor (ECF subfamily)